MARRKISQREAHALDKRVTAFVQAEEARRSRWANDYPGGVNFWTIGVVTEQTMAAVKTARALGHYVVVVPAENSLRLYAVPQELK